MIQKITKSILQTFSKSKRNVLSTFLLFATVIAHAQFPSPYCDFTLTYDWEPITLVNFAGINQTSDSTTVTGATATNQGLTNYTSDTGTVAQGFTYNSILKGNTHGSYTNYFTIFIDWNQNGSLLDAGESYNVGTVASSNGVDAIQATGSVLVPSNALLGNTRMRIVKKFSSYTTTPCASTWGAAQDYVIKVIVPPCTVPTATFTVAPDCANNQFSVNVNITNMGSATSIGIGDGTTTYGNATATGNYIAGPYTSASVKTITLANNSNALCNITSSAQTYNCPPLNDEPSGASTLTVNGDLNCTATIAGSTIASTQSADAAPSCSATGINDDVWYKFTATSSAHQFKFTNVTSGTMAVALYTGAPGALVGTTDCGSGATVNFFDLVPNTQYYARIYTTTATTTTTTNFTVCLGTIANMTYDSLTTTQASSSAVLPGAVDQQILGIKVYTAGGAGSLNATKFDFTTSGTMTPGDLSNAKVYSTGTSSTFATTTLFGTAVANPNGSFSVIGSQGLNPLASGVNTNYFWLVYDIACPSVVGHTVDAICNGVTVSSVLKTPVVSNPTGDRTINAAAVPVYTATTTTTTTIGTANLTLGRINITGDNCNTSITSVKFNTSTSPAADLSLARCYYTTGTTFNTDSLFGAPVMNPNGDITFNGSKTLATGTGNYFWLTYDISCSAGTVTGVDSVIALPVSITSNNGAISVVAPSTNAKKKVNVATVPAYTATTTTSTTVGTANVTLGRITITGDNCNTSVTSVKFNTSTSPAADISQARCYYTTGTTFNTDSLYGSAIINPNGNITFNGSKVLAVGSGNNFWLVYDISCSAGTVAGVDSVVATPVSITTNSGVISVATPSTNAKKKVNTQTAPAYTATTTTSTAVAAVNLTLGRINITGDICNVTVTSVKFNTATSKIADISRARCYYTTGTTFNTDSLFGTPVLNPNGDIIFNGSKTLAVGSGNNFWLTYDISCSAGTVAGVDSVVAIPVSITTNSGVIGVATPSTNAKKGIVAATVFNTVADGDWSSSSTWACGNIPTSSSDVSINNAVTVSTSGNTASNVTISSGASLTIASGDLTLGAIGGDKKTFTSSGTLTVSSGTLNVNGNMMINAGSTFNQSGGNINVDGNAAGVIANSVASGTYLVNIATQNLNWTGGTFTIVDPHAATTSTNYAFYYNNSTANVDIPATHTVAFGNGTSADASASTSGFLVNIWPGSNRLNFGSITINGPSTNNRFVTTSWSTAVHGNLLITNGGELRTTSAVNLNGNLTVDANSFYTCSTTLGLLYYTGTGTIVASTNSQVISGAGTFRNAATSPTANFASLTINNSNAAGVTFANANSLLSGSNTGTVSGTLTMTAGIVNVGSNALTLGTSSSSTGTYTYTAGKIIGSFKRWLGASTGSRSFDIGTGTQGKSLAINFTIAPTSGGSLTAKWNAGSPGSNGLPLTEGANTYTNTSQNGYWTVSTGDGLTGGTYTATFTISGGSDAPDYSTVTIGKRATAGDPWALVGTAVAPTGNATNFTVSRTGVTGFSDFVLLLTSTPLSVKLSSFTGRNAGAVNILNWKTATEKDASHFDVMRSNDGNKFETLATVNAKNVTTGNTYEFTDNQPFEGRNFYRLNMVDINDKSVYSDVVVLSVKSTAGLSLTASPNPVNQTLNVSVNGKINGKATIQVVDITGKTVQKIQVSSNDTSIDMSTLSSGTYIIRYNDDSNSSVIKVTKN